MLFGYNFAVLLQFSFVFVGVGGKGGGGGLNRTVGFITFEREKMGLWRCNHCVLDFDLVSILLFLDLRIRGR